MQPWLCLLDIPYGGLIQLCRHFKQGHYMDRDQVVRIEQVSGIEIWFVGDVSVAERRTAIEAAEVAAALHREIRGYRLYVAGTWNVAACEWAKAEITRRGAHEVLWAVDGRTRPAKDRRRTGVGL